MSRPQHQFVGYSAGDLLNEGRYQIERELNRGATAIVYAARDSHQAAAPPPGSAPAAPQQQPQQQQVALKVMQCPDIVPIKIVKREITLSSSVAHENLVRLLDVFAERKSQLVIVWELIDGPDLLDLLNEHGGRMTEPSAAYYFVQLLDAVLLMHGHGFCHRDLKPENVMVERASQRVKLIDFGLAKHLESVQTLGVGTPDYMPPEMLQQQARRPPAAAAAGGAPGVQQPQAFGQQQQPPYDARKVDAWALGVLMYLLTSGRYPFEDPASPDSIARTIGNIMAGRRQPLPADASPQCAAMIDGLLRTSPDERSSLEDLARNQWLHQQAMRFAAERGLAAPTTGTGHACVQGAALAAAAPLPPPPSQAAVAAAAAPGAQLSPGPGGAAAAGAPGGSGGIGRGISRLFQFKRNRS